MNNKKYPSVFKMIKNFSKDLGTYIAQGAPNVTEEDYKERLETCLQCPSLKREAMRCLICGCKITIKAKWATENCPHPEYNKWK